MTVRHSGSCDIASQATPRRRHDLSRAAPITRGREGTGRDWTGHWRICSRDRVLPEKAAAAGPQPRPRSSSGGAQSNRSNSNAAAMMHARTHAVCASLLSFLTHKLPSVCRRPSFCGTGLYCRDSLATCTFELLPRLSAAICLYRARTTRDSACRR